MFQGLKGGKKGSSKQAVASVSLPLTGVLTVAVYFQCNSCFEGLVSNTRTCCCFSLMRGFLCVYFVCFVCTLVITRLWLFGAFSLLW